MPLLYEQVAPPRRRLADRCARRCSPSVGARYVTGLQLQSLVPLSAPNVERYDPRAYGVVMRKIDGGQKLEQTSTIDDPKTYTQPMEGRKVVSYWHPGLMLLEFQCEENMEGAREGMAE